MHHQQDKPALRISRKLQGKTLVLSLDGRADLESVNTLEHELDQASAMCPQHVVIDMTHLNAIADLANGTLSLFANNVRKSGGDVRYLYVLEADATTPTVPPNLDLPDGTLWRVDVGVDGAPLESGVSYGEVPSGAAQAFPAEGAAPVELVSGRAYYLAAFVDIIQPATRCVFQAP